MANEPLGFEYGVYGVNIVHDENGRPYDAITGRYLDPAEAFSDSRRTTEIYKRESKFDGDMTRAIADDIASGSFDKGGTIDPNAYAARQEGILRAREELARAVVEILKEHGINTDMVYYKKGDHYVEPFGGRVIDRLQLREMEMIAPDSLPQEEGPRLGR